MGSNPEILGTTSRLESALADDDIPVLNVSSQVWRYALERPSSAASVGGRNLVQTLDLAIEIAGQDESVEEDNDSEDNRRHGVYFGDGVDFANTTHDNGPTSRIGSFDTPRHLVHDKPRSRWGDGMAGNARRRLVNGPPPAAQPKSEIALMRSAMRSTSSLTLVESAGELGSHWARPAVMTNQSHLQNRRLDDTEHGPRLVSTSSTRSRQSAGSRPSLEITKTTPPGSQSRALPVGTEWPHVRGSATTHASNDTGDNKKDRAPRPGMLKSAWSSVSKLVDSFTPEDRYAMSPGLEIRIRKGENCDLNAPTTFRPDNTGKIGHMVVTDLCYAPPRIRDEGQ